MLYFYSAILLFSSIYDIKYKKIKDIVNIIIIIMAVIKYGIFNSCLYFYLLYAVLQTLFILVLTLKLDFIGGGDIKFMFANSIFLSFEVSVLGVIIGLILMIFINFGKKGEVPMIPYLSVGYLISYFI